MSPRLSLFAICAVAAGCAATRTIVDSMRAQPLSPTPFHSQLSDKPQCMHCHTQIASAPPVPHPDYKKCTSCHQTGD